MLAKRFFYVCAGLLCLALAYHFGAQSAGAQAPGNPVVAPFPVPGRNAQAFVTANGDIYESSSDQVTGPYVWTANVFSGPTPATRETWGGVKARYRPGAPAATQDK